MIPEREARERTLRRSKAVAAAASFGGFASLVVVLLGHPASASSSSSTTTDNQTGVTVDSDVTAVPNDGPAQSSVTPDTVSTAS